jgi:hypothetical protein
MARELLNVKFNHLDIWTSENIGARPCAYSCKVMPMRNNNNKGEKETGKKCTRKVKAGVLEMAMKTVEKEEAKMIEKER